MDYCDLWESSMVISELVASLINQQVANELSNRLQYLQISSWCHNLGLKRLEAFFKKESDGELGHSDKFIAYLLESNTPLAVPSLPQRQSTFNDCEEIANLYVEVEAKTTRDINSIWDVAVADRDWGTQDLLQGLSREQIEEEGLAERFSNLTERAGGDYIKLDLMFGE